MVRRRHRFGFDHPWDAIVRDVVTLSTTTNSAAQALLCWDAIDLAMKAKEPWTAGLVKKIALALLTLDCSAEQRYQGGTARVYLSKMDETRDVVLNVGVKPYLDDGTTEPYYQRALFIDLPRQEFLALLARQQSIAATEDSKAEAMLRYWEIWQRFPQAQTAREACELADIDPLELLQEDEEGDDDGTAK